MSSIRGAKSYLLGHLNQMKKQQQDQIQQLRLHHESNLQQLNEGKKRLDRLIENSDSNAARFAGELQTALKELDPRIPMHTTNPPSVSTTKVDKESSPQKGGDESRKSPIIMSDSVSFDALVEQQLQKCPLPEVLPLDTSKLKRPFLKKRSGLTRFLPNPIACRKPQNVKATKPIRKPVIANHANDGSPMGLMGNLKVKPSLRKSDVPVPKLAKVHFVLPKSDEEIEEKLSEPGKVERFVDTRRPSDEHVEPFHSTAMKHSLIERDQLAEFELLEDAAQNASLSSDSSLVQDIFRGNPAKERAQSSASGKRLPSKEELLNGLDASGHSDDHSEKVKLYFLELCAHRKKIEEQLREIELKESTFADGDAEMASSAGCDKVGSSSDKVSIASSGSSVDFSEVNEAVIAMCGPALPHDERGGKAQRPIKKGLEGERVKAQDSNSKLAGKLDELEKEIKIYKDYNRKLAVMNCQKEKEIKELNKEREEFEKVKESEKAKLEAEIIEKRSQIRREKQTFERYQKLRKDLPGRKDNEEFSAMRQKNQSLQEELKKLSVKSSSEGKHLRKLLAATQAERDRLRIEKEHLEKQHQELLSTLQLKEKKTQILGFTRTKSSAGTWDKQPVKECRKPNVPISSTWDGKVPPKMKGLAGRLPTVTKPQLKFNLEPNSRSLSPAYTENPDIQEIQHVDKVEKLYPTGERTIQFPSGTKKWISSDGTHVKFDFYNGDSKEIFPDKKIVYKFLDGTVEMYYPDGLQVFEFPNKQIERHYSDGMKQIVFPDGTEHFVCTDGTEQTKLVDGTIAKVYPDGTESIEFASGEIEIRAAEYLRRQFLDGTVKTVYKSGRQETRFPDGAIRIKGIDGKVVVDTRRDFPTN